MSLEQRADATWGAGIEDDPALEYEHAPCGYLSTTPDGRIVKVNATFCAWLGMEPEQLLGRKLVELLTVGGRIFHDTHYAPMLAMQGTAQDVAFDLMRADRSRLPVLINASVARSADGQPHLVRVAVFDATGRRAYERELIRTRNEQEVELEARAQQAASATATVSQILDAATDTVLVASSVDFVVTHFNRGAQKMLGYRAEEVIGRSMIGFRAPAEVLRHAEALGVAAELSTLVPALVRHGAPRDWTLVTRSGEHRTMSLSFTEIRDDHRLLGFLCAGEDVSIRLRTEAAQAAVLRRELESVARLKDADRVKDEVVSTISHELRTPIASIRGYSELLIDGDLGDLAPAQVDAVAKVLRNAARLSALVDNLVYLDREHSTDEVSLRLEPNDLGALVVKARESFDHLTIGRELGFRVEVPDTPVPVLCDPSALSRIVSNLASNAIKFTPDGGSVTLTVSATPTGAMFAVADNGIGMSEEDRARARDRFYRSSEAYRLAIPGTGLGLTVVDDMVAALGGAMEIVSSRGRGTTVTVVLPAHAKPATTDRPESLLMDSLRPARRSRR